MSQNSNVKRVVSKQTKLLFIAFGAASIASICIVYSEGPDRAFSSIPKANSGAQLSTPARLAK